MPEPESRSLIAIAPARGQSGAVARKLAQLWAETS
jgi:hypothetical protein